MKKQKCYSQVKIYRFAVLAMANAFSTSVVAQQFKVEYDTIQEKNVNYTHVNIQDEDEISFHFEISSSAFNETYANNAVLLQKIDSLFWGNYNSFNLDSIVLIANSSIDGLESNNYKLSKLRAESVKKLLIDRYPSIDTTLLVVKFKGEDWQQFRDLVVADESIPYKSEMLKIIDQSHRTFDSREWLLKIMRDGEVWVYLSENLFPIMRNGSSLLVYHYIDSVENISYQEIINADTIAIDTASIVPIVSNSFDSVLYEKKPLFALKTNLLFDALSLVNAEIEIPIGKKWSVATDWMFPWWTFDNGTIQSGRHRIQALYGTVIGKYWFGDRDLPVLTGWHAGVYTGGGLFDFEYNREGVQGEFFMAGGLTCGYAHTIHKSGNLRMEYSLGVGCLKTKYCTYTAEYYGSDDWRAVRRSRGNYTWVGPTQAKVALVWMLNYKGKSKRQQ